MKPSEAKLALAPEDRLYIDIERVVAAHREEYNGSSPAYCLLGELKHLDSFASASNPPGPQEVAEKYGVDVEKASQVYESAVKWQEWGQSWKRQLANARRVLRVRRQKLVDRGLLPQKVEASFD